MRRTAIYRAVPHAVRHAFPQADGIGGAKGTGKRGAAML
jgi:hypothetical protein